MIESVGKFTAVLDELRRKHLGAFELWLNGALGKNPNIAEREIAERKRTEHALEQANTELLRANRALRKEAEERRRDLNAERDRCWSQHHQWWNAREHRWETERNWEQERNDSDRH